MNSEDEIDPLASSSSTIRSSSGKSARLERERERERGREGGREEGREEEDEGE